jgi:hypothetical protein
VRHHHVNLGVAPGDLPKEHAFLVDMLGYSRLPQPDDLREQGIGVNWFEGTDGAQIHLSEDPDHQAPARAHVAVEFDDGELDDVVKRLDEADWEYSGPNSRPGFPRVLQVRDPAGNLWELRGPM